TRLTSAATSEITPSWSPDGQSILFVSHQDGVTNIYRINADGSGQVNLSDNPILINQLPVWSPDGSQVLFTASAYSSSTTMGQFDRESTGVTSALIHVALMAAVVIILAARWALPVGSLTLLLGLNALLMSVLNDQYVFILPALVAGVIADGLLLILK